MLKKIAVIGTGHMAFIRTKAFLATNKVKICAVASKKIENAKRFAKKFSCNFYTDNYKNISRLHPDIILIEVPHKIQDNVSLWAIKNSYHLLIGGCLSRNLNTAKNILKESTKRKIVIECGFEARYKKVWLDTKKIIEKNTIGKIIAVRSIALYPAENNSWYFNQEESGGMPVTHLTYAFINPLRWIFGDPEYLSAFSNRIIQNDAEKIKEETSCVTLYYNNGLICNILGGYIKPPGAKYWMLNFIGSKGSLNVYPGDMNKGKIELYKKSIKTVISYKDSQDPFKLQADTFLIDIEGKNTRKNTPEQTIGDIILADAITKSNETKTVIKIKSINKAYL